MGDDPESQEEDSKAEKFENPKKRWYGKKEEKAFEVE